MSQTKANNSAAFLGRREQDARTFWEWEGGYSIEQGKKWWINFPHPVEPMMPCVSKPHAYACLRWQAKVQGVELDPCPEIVQEMEVARKKYNLARCEYATSIGVDAFAKY